MSLTTHRRCLAVAVVALLPCGALHADSDATPAAIAEVANASGQDLGTVSFRPRASGLMHIVFDLSGIEPGEHGIHVHETGDCSAADFTSAGGHLAGDAAHGIESENGPHPGDLPNAHVGADGLLRVEHFTDRLTLAAMQDGDGAAVIVHSGPDDYRSQPSGDAGSRIACGVIAVR